MLPKTLELPDDPHENFIDELVFEEEGRLVEANNKALDAPSIHDTETK